MSPLYSQTVPTGGLKLWLQADKGITVDSTAFRWADQSGSNTAVVQTSTSARPTQVAGAANGKPAVRFDGIDDHLPFRTTLNGLTQATLILVSSSARDEASPYAGVDFAPLAWLESGSWGYVYLSPYQTNTQFRFGTGETNNRQIWTRSSSIGTSLAIHAVVKNGNAERLYSGGNLVLSRTAQYASLRGISDQAYLGRGNKHFAGNIAEVLVYDRALTDAERESVEDYLSAKYAGSRVNTAPSVNAGADRSATVGVGTSLAGTVSDDGLPSGSVQSQWSRVSGPGTVTFANSAAASTTATFSAAGTYVLRLTANDGSLSASDDVSVSVLTQAPSSPPQPPPPSSPVGGGIEIHPGTDIQAAVNSRPEGTRFILKAGVHRLQSVVPKNRNIFSGEPGAVMSGAKVLTQWIPEGAFWYAPGQSQQGGLSNGECAVGYPRCRNVEDLFLNNAPLRHVGSKGELGPGKWFFDYNADRIYVGENPAGKTAETSVTRYAFRGFAVDVVIEGLIVEKYASPAQQGAIGGDQVPPAGWIVRNNEVRWNHGLGIKVGTRGKMLNNFVHHNGQMGINIGNGENQLVEGNELSYNNWAGYHMGWEAGGSKFSYTKNLVVRGNYAHHNNGGGLWTDIDNIDTLYENNRITDNAGTGLSHEISYDCIIRNNVIERNGVGAPWLWGAQIQIQNSQGCEVYNNTVRTDARGGNGLALIQQNRGYGGYGPYLTMNNYVHHNTVIHDGNSAGNGAVADFQNGSFFNQNNRFDYNTYRVKSLSNRNWAWFDGWWTWNEFRARGLEPNSTASVQ
ncbi:MAG: right-handed parallel beta-helix repeat-containing protein [Bryobacteraceae bacterium]|nr:right-handed parallel beta-helix repeat-containing protein [Bryobacteraceae bacterium]